MCGGGTGSRIGGDGGNGAGKGKYASGWVNCAPLAAPSCSVYTTNVGESGGATVAEKTELSLSTMPGLSGLGGSGLETKAGFSVTAAAKGAGDAVLSEPATLVVAADWEGMLAGVGLWDEAGTLVFAPKGEAALDVGSSSVERGCPEGCGIPYSSTPSRFCCSSVYTNTVEEPSTRSPCGFSIRPRVQAGPNARAGPSPVPGGRSLHTSTAALCCAVEIQAGDTRWRSRKKHCFRASWSSSVGHRRFLSSVHAASRAFMASSYVVVGNPRGRVVPVPVAMARA